MKGADALFGQSGSLRRALVVNILIALVFCIGLASYILTYEFYEHLAENRNGALTREAEEIAAQIVADAPDLGLDATDLRFRGSEGVYRYTVLDHAGRALIGGETVMGLPERVFGSDMPVALDIEGLRAAIALSVEQGAERYIVLVSMPTEAEAESQWREMLHEITEELQWVVIGVVAIVLAATLATRSALKSLSLVSSEAREIGPGAIDRRLSTVNLPAEIQPLVRAVNAAFDRLEQGYRAQRDFSSNVAHEVRTPLAVLRSSIDRIAETGLRERLRDDVMTLEQMFEQLIDLSRAEALGLTEFDRVDLHDLALHLAQEMGVEALRKGRPLAVSGSDGVVVNGHAGLLGIALSNLIRNAVIYAPEGQEIEIEITANPPGFRVLDRGPGISQDQKSGLFQRFRRGAQSRAGGAGIGLAIVKSVADAHGAEVSVTDRPGGGSIFGLAFAET